MPLAGTTSQLEALLQVSALQEELETRWFGTDSLGQDAECRNRQARCEDDVNKITRLGRILDDKALGEAGM